MNNQRNKNDTQADTTKTSSNKMADDTVFSPVPLKLITESAHPQSKNTGVQKNNNK